MVLQRGPVSLIRFQNGLPKGPCHSCRGADGILARSTGVDMETDYLVIGAGALGMGFVDTLLEHSDAEIVIVDRRHGAGGHWLDSYSFVQLHQPSMNYGVNSTPLGRGRVEK